MEDVRNPDIIPDNSLLINEIMKRPETRSQSTALMEKMKDIETMYVPKEIMADIVKKHTFSATPHRTNNGLKIARFNPELERRSLGRIRELNIAVLKGLLREEYDRDKERIDRRFDVSSSDAGETYFTELYFHSPSVDAGGSKRTYSVFQLYVHRPSSTYKGDKFEAYLEVQNTDPKEAHNKFVLKIEEVGKDIYAVEQMTWGRVLEHHIQIVKGKREEIITLPEKVRNILEENQYRAAPLWTHFTPKFRAYE